MNVYISRHFFCLLIILFDVAVTEMSVIVLVVLFLVFCSDGRREERESE